MLSKKFIFLMLLANCFIVNIQSNAQSCPVHDQSPNSGAINRAFLNLTKRSTYSFQLVFHIMYFNDEENISYSQILSQMEILNEIYNKDVNSNDLSIPEEFRHLKANPGISFCLADKDPNGMATSGVTRTKINDPSLACKMFMGNYFDIMHTSLGGLDVWNPEQFINVYVVNFLGPCNVLGRAIFPWDATIEDDGIILDYRAVGFIGTAANNMPFHQGKTLAHEMGHFFGLKHLSNDDHCQGDDMVADTPPQSNEFIGCPSYPHVSCGTNNMTMNYMCSVNDACMHLFTKGQVDRMHAIIDQYRNKLSGNPCIGKPITSIDKLIWLYNLDSWQIKNPENLPWSGQLELFEISGKLIWYGQANQVVSISFPQASMNLQSGIYFLRIRQDSQRKIFKLLKYT